MVFQSMTSSVPIYDFLRYFTLLIVIVAFSSNYERGGIAIDIESKQQTLALTLALIKHLKRH